MKFLEKYKIYIIVALIVIILVIAGIFLFRNSNIRKKEKEAKVLIDSLHKYNSFLLKEKEELRDSIQIFHNQAIATIFKDTIYINQIKYLKTKTNEEANSVYNNSIDSNLKLHAKLSSEFISGLSGTDSL